jgi:hypothetical protein
MKCKVVIVLFGIILCAGTGVAQITMMFFTDNPVLYTQCPPNNTVPVPDGTPIRIMFDWGAVGPSSDDIWPRAGLDSGCVNYNIFLTNGGSALGAEGAFVTDIPFLSNCFPSPPRIYLVCYYPNADNPATIWYSNSFPMPTNPDPVDMAVDDWNCTGPDWCPRQTESVTLTPNNFPLPAHQNNVHAQVWIGNGTPGIVIPTPNVTNIPHLRIVTDPQNQCGFSLVRPVEAFMLLNWSYIPLQTPVILANGDTCFNAFATGIRRVDGANGCGACVILDSIEVFPPNATLDLTIQPFSYSLEPNYPNPFNPTTEIAYNLKAEGMVSIKVYDITGREVQTLINGLTSAGHHTVTFNGASLPSGMYLCRMQAGDFVAVNKMLLLK